MAKKKEAKKKELKVVNEEVINGAKIITYEDGSVDIIPAVIHLTAEQASDLFNSDEDSDDDDSDDDLKDLVIMDEDELELEQ